MRIIVWVLVLVVFAGRAWGQDGSLDTTYNTGRSFANGVFLDWPVDMIVQHDNKILSFGNSSCYRFNLNGAIDSSFSNINVCQQNTFGLSSDDKIVCGRPGYVCRLKINGLIDSTFHSNLDTGLARVSIVKVLTNGKILVGGYMSSFNGLPGIKVVRLSESGTLDSSFNFTLFDRGVRDIQIQADGKILISGDFYYVNNIYTPYMVRLHEDGQLDTSFHSQLNSTVEKSVVHPNGEIFAYGYSLSFSNIYTGCILRLHANGSLDTTFKTPLYGTNTGGDFYVLTDMMLQRDGKLITCGAYQLNGLGYQGIMRFNFNGTIDTTLYFLFHTSAVPRMRLQSDGKIIISYQFPPCQNAISRLNNSSLITYILEKPLSASLILSPNPAHHTATLTPAQPLQAVRVVGMDGKVMRTQAGGVGTVEVDVRGVAPGMYSVEGVGVDGTVVRSRLVVE